MIAHWNIKAALRGHAPPFAAGQIASIMAAAGERGRELGRAESEVRRGRGASRSYIISVQLVCVRARRPLRPHMRGREAP
jgi:hypothetical protein